MEHNSSLLNGCVLSTEKGPYAKNACNKCIGGFFMLFVNGQELVLHAFHDQHH